MKPAYEIVTASELEIGDRFLFVLASKAHVVQVNRIEPSGTEDFTLYFDRNGYIKYPGYHPLVRQLPPERNPEVLERALKMAVTSDFMGGGPNQQDPKFWIWAAQQAIRELESEAGK